MDSFKSFAYYRSPAFRTDILIPRDSSLDPMAESIVTQAPAAQDVDTNAPASQSGIQIAPTGERQVFQALRRQLSDDDLAQPGVQKLILHMLEQAQAERDDAESFRLQFNASDKEVAVLREKVKSNNAVDVAFGTGTGLGGVLLGAAFYFWGKTPPESSGGNIVLWIGILLFGGAVAIKFIKVK